MPIGFNWKTRWNIYVCVDQIYEISTYPKISHHEFYKAINWYVLVLVLGINCQILSRDLNPHWFIAISKSNILNHLP